MLEDDGGRFTYDDYGGCLNFLMAGMDTPCDYLTARAQRVDEAKQAALVFEQRDPFIDFLPGVKMEYLKRNANNLLTRGRLQFMGWLNGVWSV